jgi:hypothetical protein
VRNYQEDNNAIAFQSATCSRILNRTLRVYTARIICRLTFIGSVADLPKDGVSQGEWTGAKGGSCAPQPSLPPGLISLVIQALPHFSTVNQYPEGCVGIYTKKMVCCRAWPVKREILLVAEC